VRHTVYLVLVEQLGQCALNAYLNREAAHGYARDVEGVVMSLPVDADYGATPAAKVPIVERNEP
jgi:hypothetical protein